MPALAEKRLCRCGKTLCFTIDAKDAAAFKELERKVVRCTDCGRIYGLDRFRELERAEHPVTTKIRLRERSITAAQARALRLAAAEGSLIFIVKGRHWSVPSREERPRPRWMDPKSSTVFALERRGLLQPEPEAQRGDTPRPRVITELGRAFLREQDSRLVGALNQAWRKK